MEPFKKSSKSICVNCTNINEKCSLVSKTCGTDSKAGLSFVERCSLFNKEFKQSESGSAYVLTVDNATDTRIEMMGGGYVDTKLERDGQ